MNIVITRRWRGKNTTLSSVTVDGQAHHFILEDIDRGLDQSMSLEEIKALKVKSVTAIPTGTYEVAVTYSNRFKRLLPILLNVPGFEGIRFHPGNFHIDTEGCLLPGMSYELEGGDYRVITSRIAHEKLFNRILATQKAGGKIWCTIQTAYQ